MLTKTSDAILSKRSGTALSSADNLQSGLSNDEVQSLLNRVAQMQQDKWTIEERLRLLEESSSAMSDALLEKSALIQFYCMEGRAGKSVFVCLIIAN
jgi:phage/plasmid-associated DNA primase